jgi:hypothetical protein
MRTHTCRNCAATGFAEWLHAGVDVALKLLLQPGSPHTRRRWSVRLV